MNAIESVPPLRRTGTVDQHDNRDKSAALHKSPKFAMPRRRLFQVMTAAGFAAMGVFPAARAAYADGYDIYDGPCPSYAADHDCSPGCGPSTIFAGACAITGTYKGFHLNDGVTWTLRPNQCYSGSYDGWLWKYNGACGTCATSVERRCHDGYRKSGSGWVRSICRWNTECGCQSTVEWPTIESGNSGADVQAIQRLLMFHEHELDADGIFGPLTKAAVEEFQTEESIEATGIVDAHTWALLVVTTKRNDINDAVRAAQIELNKHGHKLEPDGNFGQLTEDAVKDFQRQSKLTVDAIIGQNTWRTLAGGAV